MSGMSITESDISEIDFGEDYKDAIQKSILLAKELDENKLLLKDREFELNTVIQSLNLENESLKKSIHSYSELVEFYKRSENRTHNLIMENNNTETYYINKQLESKILLVEQNEYNLKREIITLKSVIDELKSELEKNNNNNLKIIEFDENEVKELINEIEELKCENKEISDRALNMLTEKEVVVMQLKEEIEELKEIIRDYEDEIGNLKEELYSLPNGKHNFITDRRESLKSMIEDDTTLIKKDFSQRVILNKEIEKLNNIIEELELRLKTSQIEHEMEISKYKQYLMKYEYLDNNSENDDLNKDSTIDNYPSIILGLEQKLADNELYYRSQIKVLQNEMDEMDREKNSNLQKIKELLIEIEELKKDNLERQSIVHETIKRLNSVQDNYINDNDTKLNEITELKLKIEALERERNDLKNETRKSLVKFENETNELSDKLRITEECLREEKKKIEDKIILFEQMNIDENKNITLNKLCDDEEITILKNRIEDLESENKKLKLIENDEIKELRIIITQLEKEKSNQCNSEEIQNLKNKIAELEIENSNINNKLNSFGKRSVNVFRLKGEIDFQKSENSKLNTKLNEIKEQYELQINDLLQKLQVNNSETRPTTKKPNNFNSNHLIEIIELEEKNKELIAEKKFLLENIDILKNEIENIKTIDQSIIKKYKDECDELKDITAEAKIKLAQVEFEKEKEITKYKLLSRKMKGRLNSIYTSCTTDTTELVSPRKKSFFNSLFK